MMSDVLSLKANAKKRIGGVFIGIGILLFSWLLLNQINPDLASNIEGKNPDGTNVNIIFGGLRDLLP